MDYNLFKSTLLKELGSLLNKESQITIEERLVDGKNKEYAIIRLMPENKDLTVDLALLFAIHADSGAEAKKLAGILFQSLESFYKKDCLDTSSIVYRIVDSKNCTILPENLPSISFCGMKIIFTGISIDNDDLRGSLVITEQIMKNNNLTLEQLDALAKKNTFRIYPSNAEPFSLSIFKDVIKNREATLQDYQDAATAAYYINQCPPAFVCGSQNCSQGCLAMLDTAYLDHLAGMLGFDLAFLPVSWANFLILPLRDSSDIPHIKEMVADSQNNFHNDVPTENVLYYSRESKSVRLLEDESWNNN